MTSPGDGTRGGGPASAETLLRTLRDPRCYPHPVQRVDVVETPRSYVLLTGRYAYKLRKPLPSPVADRASAERRRMDCEREVALHDRGGASLYLDVVPLAGPAERPRIGAGHPLLDYSVRMREFGAGARLDRLVDAGGADSALLDALARRVAWLHEHAPVAERDSGFGTSEHLREQARRALAALEAAGRTHPELAEVGESLRRWSAASRVECGPRFRRRLRRGRVRECHGDLRLANFARLDGDMVPFACVAHDPALRWMDTCLDAATLATDIESRAGSAAAWRFLDGYLAETGDYEALPVLRHYLVHGAISHAARTLDPLGADDAADAGSPARLLAIARRHARVARPAVLVAVLGGTAAAGALARAVARHLEAVAVRHATEAHRLGLPAGSPDGPGRGEEAHARLETCARHALEGGYGVVVEAPFTRRRHRRALAVAARDAGASFRILAAARQATSDRGGGEGLDRSEREVLVVADPEGPDGPETIAGRLARPCRPPAERRIHPLRAAVPATRSRRW